MQKLTSLFFLFFVVPVYGQSSNPYDPTHDRIWSSMIPNETYIRNSPSQPGGVEFLVRIDEAHIQVQAPANGKILSVKPQEDFQKVTFQDSTGKLYYYRFSKTLTKQDQMVKKGQVLGQRPGVARVPISITAPDGKAVNPRFMLPAIRELPPNANKP